MSTPPPNHDRETSAFGDDALASATSADLQAAPIGSVPTPMKFSDEKADAASGPTGEPKRDHDQELPQLSDQQREESTTRLLSDFHDDVFRYVFRLIGQESAADDIVQETFIRVYKSVHQLKTPAAAKGWLLAIARNEFIRWCRRRKVTSSLDDQPELEIASARDASQLIDNQEWVQEALASMKEEHRIIVAMYYYEELSYSEIAGQLDIPIGTVMSRLSRAKSHLRQHLLEKGGE